MNELELYHYGVKGMKWGVRKADYRAMTGSQKRQTRKQYRQDKINKAAEKRVDKHGIDRANSISVGKGVALSSLKSSLGSMTLGAAAKLYTTTNALGLMAGAAPTASAAAALTTYATLTGIATIPVAALGVYGLYSAGKSVRRMSKDASANARAHANKS